MSLECKWALCLAWILPVITLGLDLNEIDKSLNPRLVGQIYNLYKPTVTNSRRPISVDCDHPGVICKFGNVPLVARPISECNCKGESVPIIAGLAVSGEDKPNSIKTEEVVSLKPFDGDSEVPIYQGQVNAEQILAKDEIYPSWKNQNSPGNKDWRPVGSDQHRRRIGELPRKFYSYYPYSQPSYIVNDDDYDSDFNPLYPPPFPNFQFGSHKHSSSSSSSKNSANTQRPLVTRWRTTTGKPSSTAFPATTKTPPVKIDDKLATTKTDIIVDDRIATSPPAVKIDDKASNTKS